MKSESVDILYREESYRIIGACFEVYNEMGCGFLEAVYHECLRIEFACQAIEFASKSELTLAYKGRRLKQTYVPDFLLFGKIVLEIKAVKEFAPEHRAKVHNYLRATKYRLGLLVNFGQHPKLNTNVSFCN